MTGLKIRGFALGAVAACTYGMNPLFALPLYADGMRVESVLFWRYAIATAVLLAMLIGRRGGDIAMPLRHVPAVVILGVLMALSSQTLFASYNFMAAGVASTMLFVYPIMTAVLMWVFFHEHASVSTVLAILLALVGILLLYKGDDGSAVSAVGTLLVMASALSYAIYLVGINHAGLGGIAPLKVTFYVILAGLGWFALCTAWTGGVQTPSRLWLWGCAAGLGMLPTAVSLLCTTAAIPIIGSTATAILGALEPVTAVLIGTFVFGEPFGLRLAAGIALILTAVVLVITGSRVHAVLLHLRRMWPRHRGS